jgi:monothiol glutaredoxin
MRTLVIRLSDSARRVLQEAAVDAGGDPLRIQINDRSDYDLIFGSRAEGDLDVDCGGITILLDPSSARRADGLSIDFVGGPDGAAFTIENPNEPPRVSTDTRRVGSIWMLSGHSRILWSFRKRREGEVHAICQSGNCP